MRRLLAALAVATLGAAVVGILRQRHELVGSSGGPARPAGPIGAWLGAWIPDPPTTPLGRAAARTWAAPLTAVGLIAAATTLRKPRWDAQRQCLVVRGVRGPSAVALRAVGARANTIGHVVLARPEEPTDALLAHEAVHVRQAERLGPFLLPAYVWLAAWHGYRNNPLEVAARAGAERRFSRAAS